MLKGKGIQVLGLEQGHCGMGHYGTGTLACFCSGLSSRNFSRVGDPAAPEVSAVSNLKPSYFFLSDMQWQSDQVVVSHVCSLLTWQ